MALILAIEPDRRQAAQLTELVRARVKADLVLADTTERALGAIGNRVPDLVLIPTLLSPQDDAALAGALRLIATAAHVQMLTIPVFADRAAPPMPSGFFARFRKRSASASTGCDPAVFAGQIAGYLADVAAARETALEDGPGIEAEEPVVEHVENIVAAPTVEPIAAQIEEPIAAQIVEPPVLAIEELATRVVEVPMIRAVDEPIMRVVEEPIIRAFEVPAAYEREQTAYRSSEPPVVQALAETVAPATEEAAIERRPIEQLAIEQPAIEQPAIEQLAFEEPAFEEPAFEVAAVAESPVAEPAAAELTHAAIAESIVPVVDDAFEPPIDDPIAIAIWQYTRAAVPEPAPLMIEQPIIAAIEVPIAAASEEPAAGAIEEPIVSAVEPAVVAIEPTVALEPEPARVAAARVLEFTRTKPLSQAELDLLYFVEAGSPPELPAPKVAPKPAPTPARNDWSELVASLRVDVERMRAERSAPSASNATTAARVLDHTPAARKAWAAKKPRGARPRAKEPQPVQNEWGFFDPEQCGFAALLAKLEEITDAPDDASAHVS